MEKNDTSGVSSVVAQNKQLIAKFFDMAERCERQCVPVFSKFLRAEELAVIAPAMKSSIYRTGFTVFGGFDDSERCVAGFLPDYLSDPDKQTLCEYLPVVALKICGSGYRKLSHRDFLGAILSLGVNREAVGDIYVVDEKCAYIAVLDTVSQFIASELDAVGRDKVCCEIISPALLPKKEQQFEQICDTVASLRLDAVAAAILGLSRDKAERLISSGEISVNHVEVTEKSFMLSEGALLSVHGRGRFLLSDTGELTKKGRIRITVKRYI